VLLGKHVRLLSGTFLCLWNDPQACFATGEDGRNVLFSDEADDPPERTERERPPVVGSRERLANGRSDFMPEAGVKDGEIAMNPEQYQR
jgi:hypothetical protein